MGPKKKKISKNKDEEEEERNRREKNKGIMMIKMYKENAGDPLKRGQGGMEKNPWNEEENEEGKDRDEVEEQRKGVATEV